ncbi:MAG: hypothetical protein ACMXYC_03025 [Candidatus Woesearchaeota archaeon]
MHLVCVLLFIFALLFSIPFILVGSYLLQQAISLLLFIIIIGIPLLIPLVCLIGILFIIVLYPTWYKALSYTLHPHHIHIQNIHGTTKIAYHNIYKILAKKTMLDKLHHTTTLYIFANQKVYKLYYLSQNATKNVVTAVRHQ